MRRGAGFTLIEVLLALLILATTAGLSFGMLVGMLSRRERAARDAEDLAAGGAIVEWVERAAFTTTVVSGSSAGIVGTGSSLTLIARGVSPGVFLNEGLSDATEASLRWEASSWRVVGSPERGAAWASGGAGEEEVLSERVERLALRYFDGRTWRTRFDSGAVGRLPVAIEVSVWFSRGDARPAGEPGASAAAGDEGAGAAGSELAEDDQTLAPEDGEAEGELAEITRAPDRFRVVIVPDGPRAGEAVGR